MITAAERARWNKAAPVEGLGDELHATKDILKATYSFAVNGGAISNISLLDDDGNVAQLPAKAIIQQVYVDVITPPTSLGLATIGIQSEAAGDLLGDSAIAGLTGILDGIPAGVAANMIKLTADRIIKANVKVAALTAGKFTVFIEYVQSA